MVDWVPVLFITLTHKNDIPKESLIERCNRFYGFLSHYTRSHIWAHRGFKTGNSHEHAKIMCPEDEVDRFWSRVGSFNMDKAWCEKVISKKTGKTRIQKLTGEIDVFDNSRDVSAVRYALCKHQPVLVDEGPEFYCPEYYGRCKRGECSHIPLVG